MSNWKKIFVTIYVGQAYYMGNAAVEFAFSAGLLISSSVMGIWGGLKKRFLMISASINDRNRTILLLFNTKI